VQKHTRNLLPLPPASRAGTISIVANVSYLRTPTGARRSRVPVGRATSTPKGMRPGRWMLVGLLLVAVAVIAVGAIIFASAKASLTSDPQAIAKIGMPLGGGKLESVSVVTGPHAQPVAVKVTGDAQIWPRGRIPANEKLSIQVVVKRPGWISWLSGSKQTMKLTLTTPAANLRSHYITVPHNGPLRLHFKSPIEVFSYGRSGHLARHVLGEARRVVTLPRSSDAGSTYVSAAPRRWEEAGQAMVSWFPAGGSASAVASPTPGSQIKPSTPITLNFSKPVAKALGSHRPVLSPATPGHWRTLTSHAIEFVPDGYGYGLGAKVSIAMPSGVRLVGGKPGAGSDGGGWTVPGGSVVRLQQLLAILGYLPLKFHYAGGTGPGLSPAAQENAAVNPPKGTFKWRYPNTPAALKDFWKVGASGVMMQGALMAFENDHGLTADGQAGPLVWKSVIAAVLAGKHSSFGYTFVDVSVGSQSLTLWHSGKTVISGTPVNTGIPSAPTATGTYPVYEHLPSTTMSGTNPDGSHYSDPGIPYVSYFNGGDALHGFTRASYGSPQSLGCVEMPFSVAGQVYPYTPIGTLVHVA
jgi:peptidoglycan hydrolase-like protein with peptidoglycan-binding domain